MRHWECSKHKLLHRDFFFVPPNVPGALDSYKKPHQTPKKHLSSYLSIQLTRKTMWWYFVLQYMYNVYYTNVWCQKITPPFEGFLLPSVTLNSLILKLHSFVHCLRAWAHPPPVTERGISVFPPPSFTSEGTYYDFLFPWREGLVMLHFTLITELHSATRWPEHVHGYEMQPHYEVSVEWHWSANVPCLQSWPVIKSALFLLTCP